jgi:N-acetylmuramoyl-L-alanine amidase
MPAVLVESGFLSNPQEERMLKNGFYRQKVAEAIAEGLGDYAADAPFMEARR